MFKKLAIIISLVMLSLVGVAYAGSGTLSGTGPTMTMRGTEYIQNFVFSNPGAQRTISSVSWNQSFNTGYMSAPGCPGLPSCVPNPQPVNMIVHICLTAATYSCYRIDGKTSGSTNYFSGVKWTDYAMFTLHWEPQGSGVLTPTAYGKTNNVTVNWN